MVVAMAWTVCSGEPNFGWQETCAIAILWMSQVVARNFI